VYLSRNRSVRVNWSSTSVAQNEWHKHLDGGTGAGGRGRGGGGCGGVGGAEFRAPGAEFGFF
jgi:hypothetical protein